MIITKELKLISETTSFNAISEIICRYENETIDINASKELLKIAYNKRNEILKEDTAYYPQDNSTNNLVVDASPEINRNFGANTIGYFKLFNLKVTPTIDYINSPCWRINVLSPTYENHYNSFTTKLNGKERRQLISILKMPYLNQYTKKQLKSNSIDPDYIDLCNRLLKEYNKAGIIFTKENPMIVYVWNMLLYKMNKMNDLFDKKSAFSLLLEMPDYNLL